MTNEPKIDPDSTEETLDRAEVGSAQEVPVAPPRRPSEDIIDLFLRKPLYAKIEGDKDYFDEIESILDGRRGVDYDNYCPICDQVTPWTLRKFTPRSTGGGSGLGVLARYDQATLPTIRVVSTVCLRRQHFHTYVFYVKDFTVQKIGQRPSMADIALGELKSIRGIESLDRKELGRALGLFSHDAPLGAFVYLRRVFERMIDRAHERHFGKHGAYLANWNDLRMGQRISALAGELPKVVQSNIAVWGLLSKGVHELSDNEAEILFPLLKAVIFEMLGDEERLRQAKIQSEATRKALASAASQFKSTNGQDEGHAEVT
jgi:hypothetical protein